jgi:predicted transcriptional regulator
LPRHQKTPLELGKRARQIYETVARLGEASVTDVQRNLDRPPSYSAVRATMGLLVEKGWLKYRVNGTRYVYRTAVHREKNQRTAIERMLSTFFGGSAKDAMAALLDVSSAELSDDDIRQLVQMIEQARREKR